MTPADLDAGLFISTYSERDPDSRAPENHGYQRDPMDKRTDEIADYYYENRDQITPIIVSIRLDRQNEISVFEKLFNEGRWKDIHARWSKAVCSVIDGQHRMKGLVEAWKNPTAACNRVNRKQQAKAKGANRPVAAAVNLDSFEPQVPVMLFFGLRYEEEAELFDTINTTQRKLPKALIEVTKGDITEKSDHSHAQRIREVTFDLVRNRDSVWYKDVNMTGARNPNYKVTYEGLRRSTANMLTRELLVRLENEGIDVEECVRDYWLLVSKACSRAWEEEEFTVPDRDTGKDKRGAYRIKELVGVASLAKLGRDILMSALEAGDFKTRMKELTDKLGEVDWRKVHDNQWMRSQAGFAGQKELYELLYGWVYTGRGPGRLN
jgi:hypothetical protein